MSFGIVCQLRVGQIHLTHPYLLKADAMPHCSVCSTRLTVEHLFAAAAVAYSTECLLFADVSLIEDLFNPTVRFVVNFIEAVDLYRKLWPEWFSYLYTIASHISTFLCTSLEKMSQR
jgi:hypothetical protein